MLSIKIIRLSISNGFSKNSIAPIDKANDLMEESALAKMILQFESNAIISLVASIPFLSGIL